MSTLREAEDRLAAHHAECPTCQVRHACPVLARLSGERDRLWLAQIGSLTTGRLR